MLPHSIFCIPFLDELTLRILLKLLLKRGVWMRILKNAFIYHVLQPLGIARMPKRPLKPPAITDSRFHWQKAAQAVCAEIIFRVLERR